MKNIHRITLLTLALGFIGGAIAYAAAPSCPGQGSDPYSYVCTNSSTYEKGEMVTITLSQPGRVPLFIGPDEHPWWVEDSSGNIIYEPTSTSPTTQPQLSFSWTDTWDQKNNHGEQVKKGTYTIVFPPMPYNIMPVTITIVGKHENKNK